MNDIRRRSTKRLKKILSDRFDYGPIADIITGFLYDTQIDAGDLLMDCFFDDTPKNVREMLDAGLYMPLMQILVVTRRTPKSVYVKLLGPRKHVKSKGDLHRVRDVAYINGSYVNFSRENIEVFDRWNHPHFKCFTKAASGLDGLMGLLSKFHHPHPDHMVNHYLQLQRWHFKQTNKT